MPSHTAFIIPWVQKVVSSEAFIAGLSNPKIITQDSEAITEDSETITEDSETITEDSEAITEDSEAITEDSETITEDFEIITEDSETTSEVSGIPLYLLKCHPCGILTGSGDFQFYRYFEAVAKAYY